MGDGDLRIFLASNGLRAGAGPGGGLLMERRGDKGGERRLTDALGEDGGLCWIMEARGEREGEGPRARGGGDL